MQEQVSVPEQEREGCCKDEHVYPDSGLTCTCREVGASIASLSLLPIGRPFVPEAHNSLPTCAGRVTPSAESPERKRDAMMERETPASREGMRAESTAGYPSHTPSPSASSLSPSLSLSRLTAAQTTHQTRRRRHCFASCRLSRPPASIMSSREGVRVPRWRRLRHVWPPSFRLRLLPRRDARVNPVHENV